MTAFLDRLAFWLGKRGPDVVHERISTLGRCEPEPEDFYFDAWMATTSVCVPTPEYDALVADAAAWRTRCKQAEAGEAEAIKYLHDFGPNVPVEDLGGKPMEKAP